ncbi:hypothetical protein MKW94_001210 [Papaver nudicaule]|uniref:Uncharacterized protein n=1 Tax=Papaver nudicaule TaxID=74823 RepID=A0AA41VNQ7_PAPNU|nr:hypothetical protein [Papaver nudicaule]
MNLKSLVNPFPAFSSYSNHTPNLSFLSIDPLPVFMHSFSTRYHFLSIANHPQIFVTDSLFWLNGQHDSQVWHAKSVGKNQILPLILCCLFLLLWCFKYKDKVNSLCHKICSVVLCFKQFAFANMTTHSKLASTSRETINILSSTMMNNLSINKRPEPVVFLDKHMCAERKKVEYHLSMLGRNLSPYAMTTGRIRELVRMEWPILRGVTITKFGEGFQCSSLQIQL